ncbi:hypothetical protein AVEN_154350-1 [Araneus ventricosus]|uniref:Uncharacterized protein n=1 Tax=Araneus ventricosus TaxID=182803 RepID=A0A4Y2WV40_ARAVE|nr:hypothetical protein AVEN_154350-1 [Araneus ventricosus]
MDSEAFDYQPRNVADSNISNDVSFLNQADQVSNLESSFTEAVRISRDIFSNEKYWKMNTAKINRMKRKACIDSEEQFPRLLSGYCKMFLVREER